MKGESAESGMHQHTRGSQVKVEQRDIVRSGSAAAAAHHHQLMVTLISVSVECLSSVASDAC